MVVIVFLAGLMACNGSDSDRLRERIDELALENHQLRVAVRRSSAQGRFLNRQLDQCKSASDALTEQMHELEWLAGRCIAREVSGKCAKELSQCRTTLCETSAFLQNCQNSASMSVQSQIFYTSMEMPYLCSSN